MFPGAIYSPCGMPGNPPKIIGKTLIEDKLEDLGTNSSNRPNTVRSSSRTSKHFINVPNKVDCWRKDDRAIDEEIEDITTTVVSISTK